MSILYNILKRSVFDPKNKDTVFYYDYIRDMREYSYYDLFKHVKFDIEYLKSKYPNNHKKVCFQIINNSFDDISTFIALMECGYKPILVNKNKLFELYDEFKNDAINISLKEEDFFIQMTIDKFGAVEYIDKSKYHDEKDIKMDEILPYHENSSNLYESSLVTDAVYNTINYNIIKNNIKDYIYQDDYDFGLLTSGTTGNFKVQKIKEVDLIRSFVKYDILDFNNYVNFTPISTISGLTFNLFMPLLFTHKKIIMANNFFLPLKILNMKLSVFLPGNTILFNGPKETYEDIDLSKIEHIFFLGNKTTYKSVKNIYDYFPNIKNECICNLYGSTENMGLVCKCNQKDLVPVYINFLCLNKNRLVFTYDKVNVYEKIYSSGKARFIKSNIKYDEYSFMDVMPITADYSKNEDVNLSSGSIGNIYIKNKTTGDIGFSINNRLYFLGRESEFINVNNQLYCISAIEYLINKTTRNSCVCSGNNNIIVYIPVDLKDDNASNYEKTIKIQKRIVELINQYKLPIKYINVIDKRSIPYGVEIGKLKRGKLLEFDNHPIDLFKINNYNEYITKRYSNEFRNILGKNISFKYQRGDLVFSKKEINYQELIKIIIKFKTLDFYEDNYNFCIKISDEFLMSKMNNKKNHNENERVLFIKFKEAYEGGYLRDLLMMYNDLSIEDVKALGYQVDHARIVKLRNIVNDIKGTHDIQDNKIDFSRKFIYDELDKLIKKYIKN